MVGADRVLLDNVGRVDDLGELFDQLYFLSEELDVLDNEPRHERRAEEVSSVSLLVGLDLCPFCVFPSEKFLIG